MKLNNKHRVLSVVLLMLVMMLSFASVVAFAADGVAKVGNNEYATLAEAIAAAKDGETVTLLADITSVSAPVTVPEGTEFTLDLAGHTLEGTTRAKTRRFCWSTAN